MKTNGIHANIKRIGLLILMSGILIISGCTKERDSKPEDAVVAALTTMEILPDSSHVRLVGRTYQDRDVTWLPQSGSAVAFQVTGRCLRIELAGDTSVYNERDLQPRFAVLLDGELILDDTLGEKTRTIEVFREESERNAVVEVIHLSEANCGVIGINKISVESSVDTPVMPAEDKPMHIEFIGDSITCGYGVEGSPGDTEFKTTTENFMKAFAYLTAEALNADYSTICYSGYGVISGFSADGTKRQDMLIPPLYDCVLQNSEISWDHKNHDYDVIVINLGTNDVTYTAYNQNRMEEFEQSYESFLSYVHQTHPEARIICMLGSMGGEQLFPSVEQAVMHVRESDDSDITTLFLSKIDLSKAGTDGHPNTLDQQKIAAALVKAIQQNEK